VLLKRGHRHKGFVRKFSSCEVKKLGKLLLKASTITKRLDETIPFVCFWQTRRFKVLALDWTRCTVTSSFW